MKTLPVRSWSGLRRSNAYQVLDLRLAFFRLVMLGSVVASTGCSIEQKAALGVSDAQYQLGLRRLVQEPPDYKGAVESLRSAAIDDHPGAQKQLGRLYASLRPQPDLVRAYVWLHLSAPFDLEAKRDRDALALAMSAEQIALAQELAIRYVPGEAPDLSPAATTSAVEQLKLSTAPAPESAAEAIAPVRNFFVQVGAFGARENADRLAEKLRRGGYPVALVSPASPGKTLTQVRVGPYTKRSDAVATARKIRSEAGMTVFVVEGRDQEHVGLSPPG